MIQFEDISIEEQIAKDIAYQDSSRNEVTRVPERIRKLKFDVSMAEDMIYGAYVREFGVSTFLPAIKGQLPFQVYNDMKLMFEWGKNRKVDYNALDTILAASDTDHVAKLDCHGGNYLGDWRGWEKKKPTIKIQDWIDKTSESNKRYGALIITACNASKLMPSFRGVPIFYVTGISGSPGMFNSRIVDKENDVRAYIENRCANMRHIYRQVFRRNDPMVELYGM